METAVQAPASKPLNQDNLKLGAVGPLGAIGVAVNQIIGGGIVSLTGVAIALTGGGVAWAYILGCLAVVIATIPYATLGAADPQIGAMYVWPSRILHPAAGLFSLWALMMALTSLSLYGLAAGQYMHALNPWFNESAVAIGLILVFYFANLMGAAISASVGIVLLGVLLMGFGVFIVYGMAHLDWAAYPPVLPNGFLKLLQAAALLTFATGGAVGVAELGHEMKNPGRDIPLAMVGGTALVGIVYVLIALPAAGILPIDQVANQPLSRVAEEFLPHGLWIFFILGGAMVALISTMNSQLLWGSKSVIIACDEGWLPSWVGTVNQRFGTPHVVLTLLLLVGIAPVLLGIDLGSVGAVAAAFTQVIFVLVIIASLKFRYDAREKYAASPFRLPAPWHWFLGVLAILLAAGQIWLLASDFTAKVWAGVLVWYGLGLLLYVFRRRTVRARVAALGHRG